MAITFTAAGDTSSSGRTSSIPYDPSADGVYMLMWDFREYGGVMDVVTHENQATTGLQLAAVGSISSSHYSYQNLHAWPTAAGVVGSTFYSSKNNAGAHMSRLYEVTGVRNWVPVDKSTYNGAYAGSEIQTTIALFGTTGCYQFCFYSDSKNVSAVPDTDTTILESGTYNFDSANIWWASAWKPVEADSDAMLWTYANHEYPQCISIVLAPENVNYPLSYGHSAGHFYWGSGDLTYVSSTHMENVAMVVFANHHTNNMTTWQAYFDGDSDKQITELGAKFNVSTGLHCAAGWDQTHLSSDGGTISVRHTHTNGSAISFSYALVGGVETITDDTDHVCQASFAVSTIWNYVHHYDMTANERTITNIPSRGVVSTWFPYESLYWTDTGLTADNNVKQGTFFTYDRDAQSTDEARGTYNGTTSTFRGLQSIVLTPVAGTIEMEFAGEMIFASYPISRTWGGARTSFAGDLIPEGLITGKDIFIGALSGVLDFSKAIAKKWWVSVDGGVLDFSGLGEFTHRTIAVRVNGVLSFINDLITNRITDFLKGFLRIDMSPEEDINMVSAAGSDTLTIYTHKGSIEVSGQRPSTRA